MGGGPVNEVLATLAHRFDAELGGLGPNHDRPLLEVALPAIALAAIAHLQTNLTLPTAGHLNFFFDEYDPAEPDAHHSRWAVVYGKPGAPVPTIPGPLPTVRFSARQILTIPDIDETDDGEGWTSDQREAYFDHVIDPWYTAQGLNPNREWDGPGKRHQLGGWPDPEQGPVARDIVGEAERSVGAQDAAHPDLLDRSAWNLLLQIVFDERTGLEWGDAASVYFGILGNDFDADSPAPTWALAQSG